MRKNPRNLAGPNRGELACESCFTDYRTKNVPPCKASETALHGAMLGECARCGDPAAYRVVFFHAGEWN